MLEKNPLIPADLYVYELEYCPFFCQVQIVFSKSFTVYSQGNASEKGEVRQSLFSNEVVAQELAFQNSWHDKATSVI